MNTQINLARFRHAPITTGFLTIACLLGGTAMAQRPSIATLQAQIATQQSQITTLQTQVVANLASYLTVDTSIPTRPVARFHDVNVQIVSGAGYTVAEPNGRGNLIVGYDEARSTGVAMCSNGFYSDQTSCQGGGYVWDINHKSGSHNIVVGALHNYSQYGGLVAGFQNSILSSAATVSGGVENIAYTLGSSVSGGYQNHAAGTYASVSGGDSNTASGSSASVSGGRGSTASGQYASVSGGDRNQAIARWDTVSGGTLNTAAGESSTVSGGGSRHALGQFDWVAGTLFETQ